MRFLPIMFEGEVVMRDVDELSESCSESTALSKEDFQQAPEEDGVASLQIEPGKAEECSIGSTDNTAVDSFDSLSKDASVGSSHEAVLGVEEPDAESIGQDGLACVQQEYVQVEDECAGPLPSAT